MKISRNKARDIAKTITNEQLQDMFDKAKFSIMDWTKVSNINKSISKGAAWNILAANFDVNVKQSELAKTNMILEFGDYLDYSLKVPTKKVVNQKTIIHQKPIFK